MNSSPTELALRALQMFDSLAELPSAERLTRLQALAAEDPALAVEIDKLLRADQATSGMLDHGLHAVDRTLLVDLSQLASGLKPDEHVGAFRLLRPIGQGGMGEVWLAERREGDFAQQVALKVLKRGMDSDALSRRFVQERRILAELNHPHIARFIDGGVTASGRLYYAMEYVDGLPIDVFANHQRLGLRQRVELLIAVCEAVAHAQSHLVVHRDLKPSNILTDASGQPRVLDFGIAKLLRQTDPGLETATGMHALSPAYAAPEQVLDGAITTATDVYALGVILFELLTGALPHQRAPSLVGLAAEISRETPQAPSQYLRRVATDHASPSDTGLDTRRAAREMAGDLDVIVLAALQPEPQRRYATAAALADDLRRWLGGQPIAARADSTAYRWRKFLTRNRYAVGSASAVFLSLVAGLALALWQAQIVREQAALARAEAARAEVQRIASVEAQAQTERVKDFMMQSFVHADPLRQRRAAPVSVGEAIDDAIGRISKDLATDPKLQIDLYDDFAEIKSGQGDFARALELINRALELAATQYPPQHPKIAESLVNRAVIHDYLGQADDSLKDAEQAVALAVADAAGQPTLLHSQALSALGANLHRRGRNDEALALLAQSLDVLNRLPEVAGDVYAAALTNLSMALSMQERHAEARGHIEQAIARTLAHAGADSVRLVPLYSALAEVLYQEGAMSELAELRQRQLQLLRKAYPDGHPWTASVLAEIGQEQIDSNRAYAAASLDEAITLQQRFGDAHARLLSLRARALLSFREDGPQAALVYFDQALAICAAHDPDDQLCLVLRANRAGVLARAGDSDLALAEIEATLAAMRRTGLDQGNEYAQALESLAAVQRSLGQTEQAITTATEALGRYTSLFGEAHPEAARARANLDELRQPVAR